MSKEDKIKALHKAIQANLGEIQRQLREETVRQLVAKQQQTVRRTRSYRV